MDEQEKASFEAQAQALRGDLKTWETSWAKTHDGKKPGRDDIKKNADIAAKYKQYNKVRDILSGKIPPPSKKEDAKPKKRKSDSHEEAKTPSKRSKHHATPSKTTGHLSIPLETTPSISRTLFSPVAPRSIGPTPQRDGRVLGLFDLMVERELGTPSKGNGLSSTSQSQPIMATPSKRKVSDLEMEEEETRRGKTPMSSGKRHMLDSFMTPLKRKDPNQGSQTPTTVSKLQFETPAFLKRHVDVPLDENGKFPEPAPLRLPRKPLGRGLSAIVASLRKIDEDQHDDDLDALREIEQGDAPAKPPAAPAAAADPSTATTQPPAERAEADILVADSQVRNLPLGGFDDEGMYDSPDEEQRDRDGNPLRIFKKKGQKRTTRKVNMKPTQRKRPSAPVDDVVPETQFDDAGRAVDGGLDEGDDFIPSDVEADLEAEEEREKQAAHKSKAKKRKSGAEEGDSKKGGDGPVKKAARKVNELAHANFKRLKLRNHGSKGGPGFNSRFRRKR